MRLTAIVLLAGCMTASAAGYSQQITLRARNMSLEKVFREIKKQSGYSFVYRDNWIKEAGKVDLRLEHVSVRAALDACFQDQPLTYAIVNKTIVVRLKEAPPASAETEEFVLPQIMIRGTVKNQQGEPLAGVTISLKGTQTATVTDANGNYSITLPDESGILVFSYVGYTKTERAVSGNSEINVMLSKSISMLDELVTVGYGVQKKVNVTGAVSQINGEQIADRPVSNLEQALQGMIPGLNVQATGSSGQPGEGYSVNIRGLASLANSSGNSAFTLGAPYVLVDGIPMDLNDVDPNNIKSISVLKDAASTAIYGARATYGVILITTKDGKNTPGIKVSYSYNYALAQPIKLIRQVDGLNYALIMDSAAENAGTALPFSAEAIDRIRQYMKDPEHTPGVFPNAANTDWDFQNGGRGANANTDWYDALFRRNAVRQTHNIGISGSGKNISYALSVGLFHEDGISRYAGEQYTRKTLSGKFNAQPLNWLRIGLVTKYVGSKDDYPWDISGQGRNYFMNIASSIPPTLPLKNPLGGYLNASGINQSMNERENRRTVKWVLAPSVQIEPIKDWVTTLQYNYTYANYVKTDIGKSYYQINPDSTMTGQFQGQTKYAANTSETVYASPNITSTYQRQIGDHYIAGMVGFQEELETIFGLTGNATYLLTDNVPSVNTAVGEKILDDSKGHWATRSYFARLNYNYMEKYLLEANVRRDGSSRFAPDSRWGTFPSVSVGYNIAKEKFFPFKEQISMMKFRASWGSIGNQNVANYLYVPLMSSTLGNYLLGADRPNVINPPNETTTGLSWEKVNTKDIGLDIYVFDNKLSVSADWYQSNIDNLVGPGIVLPQIYGGTIPKNNNGSLRTRGWEVQVNWRQSLSNGFSYFAHFNLSDNRSVVTSYNNPLKLLSTFYEGEVIGELWGYRADGLFQSAEEVSKYGVDQSYIFNGEWFPGDMKYRDLDGNKAIDQGKKTADDHGDLTILGNNQPHYLYGLHAGANYKGFDLSFTIQGVGKQTVWPGAPGQNGFWGPTAGMLHAVVFPQHKDYWQPDNTDAYFPRPYYAAGGNPRQKKNTQVSGRYLQNKAYTRLKALQIGYSFPTSLISKIKADKVRIYFSGDNLLTRTKYLFFDPETSRYENYPLQKVFSFGCNVTF